MMLQESTVQNLTRQSHCVLTNGQIWRNNSGAYFDEHGRMVRYGLANESAKENKRIKSSDLIGITPVVVQQHHVGRTLGVFTAYECKPEGWSLRPSDQRGLAQERFLAIVKAAGGFGGFVSHPNQLIEILHATG